MRRRRMWFGAGLMVIAAAALVMNLDLMRTHRRGTIRSRLIIPPPREMIAEPQGPDPVAQAAERARMSLLTGIDRRAPLNPAPLQIISFPTAYDGAPDRTTPPQMRDMIRAVHQRYWANFARIDSMSLDYSRHTFHRGQADRQENSWDMDAHIELKIGRSYAIAGSDAATRPFRVTFPADGDGAAYAPRDDRNWASFTQDISRLRDAKPQMCGVYSRIIENIPMGSSDGDGPRYDVLVVQTQSNEDSTVPAEVHHWFNRETGMVDLIEWRDPLVKQQAGRYLTETHTYEQIDGVWFATQIVYDSPLDGGYRIVERCSNVSLKLRQ